jgi:hypothetical protein
MASSTRFSKIGNWFRAADRPLGQVLQSDEATTITSSGSDLDANSGDGLMLGLHGLGRLEGEHTDNVTSAPNFANEQRPSIRIRRCHRHRPGGGPRDRFRRIG